MNRIFYTDLIPRIASVALFVAALLYLWLPSVLGSFGMPAQMISVTYTLAIGIFRERAIHMTLDTILSLVRSLAAFGPKSHSR